MIIYAESRYISILFQQHRNKLNPLFSEALNVRNIVGLHSCKSFTGYFQTQKTNFYAIPIVLGPIRNQDVGVVKVLNDLYRRIGSGRTGDLS